MAYSELVKSFERIRNYMREFYVYGFKSRDEYGMKSARSYDNERRRIESWLGDYMSFRQESSGKNVFLSLDSRRVQRNPLYKAFKAKSFTDKDITLHFYILDILADGSALSLPCGRSSKNTKNLAFYMQRKEDVKSYIRDRMTPLLTWTLGQTLSPFTRKQILSAL